MIGSMHSLDHRLAELRPSERDQEIARQLRDAASPATRVIRTIGTSAPAWRPTVRIGEQPSRIVAAG